jgi:ABC-2 type transport system ATP-binding protein
MEDVDLRVSVAGLVKRFRHAEALRGLDFAAEGPQVFGVVGPDGAGKTTLLRILAGLLRYDTGSVSVLGLDPGRGRDAARLKPLLGYVPQTFSMYPTLTVDENLRFAGRCHRMPMAELEARRAELLRLAQLERFAGARCETLSGGMKQKVALCGALLPRPPLIILDEPTTGVDVLARAEFWTTIREEAKRAIVIVSTSYLDEADRCDRILYMVGGRAVTIGSPREIREGAPVRVFRLGVPGGREAEAATALRESGGGFGRIEAVSRALRVEWHLAVDAIGARAAVLGMRLSCEVHLEEVETDLETALLAFERKARKEHAARPSGIREALKPRWWSRW